MTVRTRPSLRLLAAGLLVSCLAAQAQTAAPAPTAQAAPPAQTAPPASTAEPQTFLRALNYVVTVDSKAVPGVKSWMTERGDAYLIVIPSLGPVLLSLRSGEVALLSQTPAATGDKLVLPAAAARKPQGKFEVVGEAPAFAVDGKRVALSYPPPLLKLQPASALRAYNPEYERRAAAYRPDPAALAKLEALKEPVRLRVYFGTWCPTCSRVLPNLFKMTDSLKRAPITVEYYGLPQERDGDPEPERLGLRGIPTAIVYRNGAEVGRLTGKMWDQPERSLELLLSTP